MMRKGLKPKDHMKENKAIIKEFEQKNRTMKSASEAAPPPLFKMDKFKGVASRVFDDKHADAKRAIDRGEAGRRSSTPSDRRDSASSDKKYDDDKKEGDDDEKEASGDRKEVRESPASASGVGYLERRHSEKRLEELAHLRRVRREKQLMADEKDGAIMSTPRKPAVPKATETAKLAPKNDVNFIGKNRVKARTQPPPLMRRDSFEKTPARHNSFGRVPEYLEHRNQEWARDKERERERASDPELSPGMRQMSEAERVDTMAKLESSRSEVMSQLQSMPFVIETQSQKKRMSALEERLREIENAMGIFSRPKVYVAK